MFKAEVSTQRPRGKAQYQLLQRRKGYGGLHNQHHFLHFSGERSRAKADREEKDMREGRSVSPSMRLPRFDICSPEKRKKAFVLQVRVMGFVHCLRSLHDKSSSYESIYEMIISHKGDSRS